MKTTRTISNCPLPVFRKVCPQKWDDLAPTDQAAVRHCGQCDRNVYLCTTDDQTLSHARAGHCLAREMPDASELPTMWLGQPRNVPPRTAAENEALRLTHRQRGIDDALTNLSAPRSCPRCDYPIPRWRTSCRVCGFQMGRMA